MAKQLIAVLGLLLASATLCAQTTSPLLDAPVPLANVTGPLIPIGSPKQFPIHVEPFVEHVRETVADLPGHQVERLVFDATGALIAVTRAGSQRLGEDGHWSTAPDPPTLGNEALQDTRILAAATAGMTTWFACDDGLYTSPSAGMPAVKYEHYGVNGPLATHITALASDGQGNLWVGTPLGLSVRTAGGQWKHYRGRDGLPVEDVTALAVDKGDQLWIGTSAGAVQFRPSATGRKWFYRAGKRYLPDDHVIAVACAADGTPYFATSAGISRIAFHRTTLQEKAETIEHRINQCHRRLGLVSECHFDDPDHPTAYFISDNDNDGLWTAYHVAAMSLCYAATGSPRAKASALRGMEALYMLQNASGTPGLVARSVVTRAEGRDKSSQWRLTPDGKMYWKSDTSSDEIDGHYLAFFTFWKHIASHDPALRDRCVQQVREVTDYIVNHNYQLIDWTGKRTTWGFWNPENLNDDPEHYLESGLNSLQILSFLRVAHYITGDPKYLDRYKHLILEHHYLSNVLLQKKLFPDENNHSDDQLGFVAWYPILQLEHDPVLQRALHLAIRRHYAAVVPERSSFYIFTYATIDPDHADIEAGIQNLLRIPTDRRTCA